MIGLAFGLITWSFILCVPTWAAGSTYRGSVNAKGDIVGGDKTTNITQKIYTKKEIHFHGVPSKQYEKRVARELNTKNDLVKAKDSIIQGKNQIIDSQQHLIDQFKVNAIMSLNAQVNAMDNGPEKTAMEAAVNTNNFDEIIRLAEEMDLKNPDLNIITEMHTKKQVKYILLKARALVSKGQFKQALPCYEAAYHKDSENLNIRIELAASYLSNGQNKDVQFIVYKIIQEQLAKYGENHPSLAICYKILASSHSIDEYEESLKYYNKALEIEIATWDENYQEVSFPYYNFNKPYNNRIKYELWIGLYHDLLNIALDALGENHPYAASLYCILGIGYKTKMQLEQAKNNFLKARQIYVKNGNFTKVKLVDKLLDRT